MIPSANTFTHTELLNAAKKGLYQRSQLLSPDDTLAAIQDLQVWVKEELSFEEAASASFGRALSELWHSEYLDQLPPLLNKFERLVAAYFVRRGSVTAYHGFCNAWRECLLRRILLFAEEGLEVHDHGHPPAPYALLAAGSLGRREQTVEGMDPYFLVWTKGSAKYFEPFAYRVMAILDQLGLVGKEGTVATLLWRGSLLEWESFLDPDGEVEGAAKRLGLLGDLRYVCGDESIGNQAVAVARASIQLCRGGIGLQKLAADAVATPVALGFFGGIKVERNGEHKGCFDVVQGGIAPLVCAVRLLAMQHDLDPGPTLDRLEALATLDVLDKELAQRLQRAYQVLSAHRMEKEIALEQPYIDLSALSAVEQQKLKASLEAVRQLQRIIRKTRS